MKPIIKVENLSKSYRIGSQQAAYGTLRDLVAETVRAPLRRMRAGNGRPRRETLWALRDVNFEIQVGEVCGIIGSNGAGKSTLLKILSHITEPTSGRVTLYGRVGSLLEVGTGFHPELTGRENVLLNGAILGMKRLEIMSKFDEIVAFSEIERFIDTPVKFYSSGMYMRLAFAVAAHLEPEILIVDEVLAVGDAAFQKKCLNKMNEVARHGRTVIFVSHSMTAINQLCQRAILLKAGQVVCAGPTSAVVADYLKSGNQGVGETVWEDPMRAPGNQKIRLHSVRLISEGEVKTDVDIEQDVEIEIEFWNYEPDARNICVNIYLVDSTGATVLSTGTTPGANSLPEEWFERPHPSGLFRTRCKLPGNFLNDGLYYINVYVVKLGPLEVEVEAPNVLSFNVFDTGAMRTPGGGSHWAGVVRPRLPWQTEFVKPLDVNGARSGPDTSLEIEVNR